MSASGNPSPAEQHLGDRLAALVDGELEHDARERVLAHLATCWRCKAEADAQRRLKSVFAQTAPPPPSEGLLARLQGLPGLPGGDGDPGRGGGDRRGFGDAVFGMTPEGFGYVPSGPAASVLPGGDREHGFRIHDVGAAERSASRGRRFAFAAAGAVSLAAIALGGALPLNAAVDSNSRGGENPGSKVTPRSSVAPRTGVTGDQSRRRGSGLSSVFAASGDLPDAGATTTTAAATAPPLGGLSHPFATPMPTGLTGAPLILTAVAEETGPRPTSGQPAQGPTRPAASATPDTPVSSMR
ncbi:zf-HC2 domain-containing protein [Streptomyces sp. GC420]|uniref:anti-sigma factor family protein n=1 Tax=Streptomyces sp. GC420 TaxID=2697568 RepID=UPI0014151176|nr:zf-HC2 domain-containing protein [Streptomyces sp. GC420]NBM17226.1 zf-HC2 domain-containing protein [Streptomyces sp. GC420]